MKKIFLILVALIVGTPALAVERLSEISMTSVVARDVVAGSNTRGEPALAIRDGKTVRWFANAASRGQYAAAPTRYFGAGTPAADIAFFGADVVERFPEGRRSPVLGGVTAGSEKHVATYKGAMYRFASDSNRREFVANPDKYVPEVGSYCLGAMSLGRITPGDPNHALYIREADGSGAWAVFGSANGPRVWGALSFEGTRAKREAAWIYYHGRIKQ